MKKKEMSLETYMGFYKNNETRYGMVRYLLSYPFYISTGIWAFLHIRYLLMLLL